MINEQEIETLYLDVLQNMESAIVQVDNEQQDLTDFEVGDVLDALLQTYRAEATGHNPPKLRLTPLKQQLYDRVKAICEWRLGRNELEPADEAERNHLATLSELTPVSVDAIVACLKRLRISMKRWHSMGGRRGYLDFVRQYVA